MGYWPGLGLRWLDIGQVIILRVYRPMRSRGPWTHKKRTKSISSHLKRTHLVNKDFLYGFPNFSCGTERVVPRNEVITEQGTAQWKVFRLRFFVYRPEALRRPWKITKNQIFFHPAPPYLRHLFWAWRCCNKTWNCLCEWSVLRANELLTCAGQDGFFRTRWRHPV